MPLIMFVPKKLSFQEFFQTLRHRNTEPDSYNHKRRPLHKKQHPGCRYLPTKQMLFLTISFLLTSQYACRLLTPLNDDPIDRLKLLVIQVLRIPKRIVGCGRFKNLPIECYNTKRRPGLSAVAHPNEHNSRCLHIFRSYFTKNNI